MATIGVTRGLGDHNLRVCSSTLPIKPFLSCFPEVSHTGASLAIPYLLWGSRASFHLRLLYPQAPSAPSFPTRCECMT